MSHGSEAAGCVGPFPPCCTTKNPARRGDLRAGHSGDARYCGKRAP
jgi:hypothetical protein